MRTVSSDSPSKTVFTFKCDDKDSGYKTTFYMFEAKLEISADAGDGLFFGDDKYGHSWWSLIVDDDIKEFIRDKYEDFDNDKYFGPGGWWPNDDDESLVTRIPILDYITSAPGLLDFGSGAAEDHTATGTKEWNMIYYDLCMVLYFISDLDNDNKYWDVEWDNCTDEAIWIGNAMMINTISASGSYTSPDNLSDWLNDN